jgi:hypothetical protein
MKIWGSQIACMIKMKNAYKISSLPSRKEATWKN